MKNPRTIKKCVIDGLWCKNIIWAKWLDIEAVKKETVKSRQVCHDDQVCQEWSYNCDSTHRHFWNPTQGNAGNTQSQTK